MKKLLALAAISAALFAGPASAQLFLGAGAGDSRPDRGDKMWKVYGGIQLTPMFGAEASYYDFGSAHGVEYDAYAASGTITFPFNESWALLGKVGVVDLNAGGQDDTNLLLGVGVGLNLNPNFSLRLEYENFGEGRDVVASDTQSVESINFSARYQF